jgi:hypothetical protein
LFLGLFLKVLGKAEQNAANVRTASAFRKKNGEIML